MKRVRYGRANLLGGGGGRMGLFPGFFGPSNFIKPCSSFFAFRAVVVQAGCWGTLFFLSLSLSLSVSSLVHVWYEIQEGSPLPGVCCYR